MASTPPPYVSQDKVASCWAACTESWGIRDILGCKRYQYELIKDFSDDPNGTGGLDASQSKFARWKQTYSLKSYVLPPGELTQELAENLTRWNPFILIRKTGTWNGQSTSHAVLVYRSAAGLLYYMDPDQQNGGLYIRSIRLLAGSLLIVYYSSKP